MENNVTDTIRPLAPSRFVQADFRETRFNVTVERGVPLEHVLEPGFWAHVAGQPKAFDRISVVAADHAYWADLIVLSALPDQLLVKAVSVIDVNAEIEALLKTGKVKSDGASRYQVVWKGPAAKFCIVRDGAEMVQKNFPNKAEAEAWLATNQKKMAA